jgi:ribonuclease VapC
MIIDTSAIAAIFFNEPDRRRFAEAMDRADRVRMSAVNFVELSIVIENQISAEALLKCDLFLQRAEVAIVSVTAEQANIARDAFRRFGKGRHPAALNFGDCFAYALAKITGEPLLFKGDDFAKTDIASALPVP